MARKKIANLVCVLIAVLIFVGSSDAFTDLYFGSGEDKCIHALNKVKSDEPDNGSFFKPVKLVRLPITLMSHLINSVTNTLSSTLFSASLNP